LGTSGHRRNVWCAEESSSAKASCPLEDQGPQIRGYCASSRRCSVADPSELRASIGSAWLGYSADEGRHAREGFTIVDIGTILGLAHLIPEEDRRWLVNSRIDLRTFNEVY